ncbi:unnamed protein product [Anisakis simplex]|uniref:Ras-related protein Rab-3 (inferred by orthology to a C. elegans protein) n=1 Tax=Anisakis simplex TaxID=6269 RepID=A0A0M3K6A4_ANISI|nr:unnamed protein product [Anisakis simplex]
MNSSNRRELVHVLVQDTAGQERYRTITTAYYRGAMGFILMCTQIKTYSWENAQVVLVGNKCDMDDERVVSFERGRQLADQLGLEFFETSAKENINVKAVFEKLVEIICNKMAESLDSDPTAAQPKGQRLDASTTQKPPSQQCNC